MPSSWATIWAQVVSWPWPWRLGAGAQDRLAGHVDPQLGGVEHLDAEDVVLAAVAGAERLGHRRDADAEQPAALCAPPPAAGRKSCVADRLEADVEALVVLPGVGEEAERRPVREVVVAHEVDPAELGLVHAEVVGGRLDHALLEEHRLGDPERAAVGDAAGRLVGVDAAGGQVRGRDVVAGERRVHQPDLELARLGVGEERAVVGRRCASGRRGSCRPCAAPARRRGRRRGAKPVEIRLPVRSSIHFTGRSVRIEARIDMT